MTTTTHPSFDKATADREALSALFDGELGGDVARFALKRLDHDRDWRETCERWSLVGDVLRAQGQALLPAGFPARVRAAAVAQVTPPERTVATPRWARWGGVGLAASVAAAALFFARHTDQIEAPAQAPAPLVATNPAPAKPAPAPVLPNDVRGAAQLASAGLVAAEVARQGSQRARNVRRVRGTQAPARTVAAPAVVPETAVATVPVLQATPELPTPFTGEAAARPWPRAVLPQLGGSGALTTDFGTASPSFYPFEPRLPGSTGEGQGQAAARDATTP